MADFRSEYEYALDEKGRVKIPAPFKSTLMPTPDSVVILTRDLEACIAIYTPEEYAILKAKLTGLNMYNKANRLLVRRYISSAFECPVDAHGRIKIPAALERHAQLERGTNITLAGFGECIQIWNTENYLISQGEADDILSNDKPDVVL